MLRKTLIGPNPLQVALPAVQCYSVIALLIAGDWWWLLECELRMTRWWADWATDSWGVNILRDCQSMTSHQQGSSAGLLVTDHGIPGNRLSGFVLWFLKHVINPTHSSHFSVSVESTHHQHTCLVRNICAVPNISQLNSANLKSSQSEQWKLCLLLDGDKWHPVIIMNFKTNFTLCFLWLRILICSEMISYLYQNHT